MGEQRRVRAATELPSGAEPPAGEASTGDATAEALAPLRDRIDAIDQEIVALLNERAQIALEIGRVKQVTGRRTVRDAAREAQVLEHVTSASAGLFPEPELVGLYRKLIAATRRVQHAQKREQRPADTSEKTAEWRPVDEELGRAAEPSSEVRDVTASPPILEFDPTQEAVIEPTVVLKPLDVPAHVVLCYFQGVIAQVVRQHGGREVTRLRSEIGDNPIYEIEYGGRRLGIVHPGVGAPLAAGFLEELVALGCRAFIAAGGAGVLVPELALGHVIVPTAAIRDEGTSYHYLPPGREVAANPDAVAAIIATLAHHDVPFVIGKTWTTDAFYRETRTKMARRVSEGCLTVEMEAAACFAVAAFRGVPFGQLLYGGDDLSGERWDERGWARHASGREMLFRLAAEAVLRLPPSDPPIGRPLAPESGPLASLNR